MYMLIATNMFSKGWNGFSVFVFQTYFERIEDIEGWEKHFIRQKNGHYVIETKMDKLGEARFDFLL